MAISAAALAQQGRSRRWLVSAATLLAQAACSSGAEPLPTPLQVVPARPGTPAPSPTPTATASPTPVPTPTPTTSYGKVQGQPDGFNAAYYARENPDVVAAGIDLLEHYQRTGKAEGRLPYEGAAPTAIDIITEGDSISVFWGGNYTGIFAAKRADLLIHPAATGGAGITTIKSRLPGVKARKPRIVTVLIGANDLPGGSYATPEAWLEALWSYTAAAKALGAKVAVGTVLPQCLGNAEFPQRRARVNAAIRDAVGTKIDAVIDYAAHPRLEPDSAACDKALFDDGLHPSWGGQNVLAEVYAPVVEQLLAKQPSEPNSSAQPGT